MPEQQGSRRARVAGQQKLVPSCSTSWIVRNFNETSAQLSDEAPLGIPTELVLEVQPGVMSRRTRAVRRFDNRNGVQFVALAS